MVRMPHDTYQSPLAARNASPEMLQLFSPARKFGLWRRIWLALAEAQQQLGITRITDEALTQMRQHLDDIDFELAADWEKRLRHDVMAHVHTFEAAAPAAKGLIHLGATSQDIVDNAELIVLRDALRLVCIRLAQIADALGSFAARWAELPALGYTHFQPAQLTTVGKRATLWAQDFLTDLEEIERRAASLRFRGIRGATGTQMSFLSLFEGDAAKVQELEDQVLRRFGFDSSFAVTGQTYPRKLDAQVAGDLAGCAVSVHKFCNDVRLLAGLKQMEEPFESEQVGSSAMAYKRNPMRCERATGLARFVMSLASSPLMTAAEQWLERTLDDSSNKRLALPEMFLALDGSLLITVNVARGLVVYPRTIAAAVQSELPFMATEEILMAGVRAGGDRQELHERIRRHSFAAAEQVKQHGRPNDLLGRLKSDAAFTKVDLDNVVIPARFTGLAAQQTRLFIAKHIEPMRRRYSKELSRNAELKV